MPARAQKRRNSVLHAVVLVATACVGFGLAFAFSGCIQLGPSDDDSAAADAAPPTVQDQCVEVMTAYCSRANTCDGEDPNACLQPAVESCCSNACGKVATSTEKSIQLCVSNMSTADCDDVIQSRLPPRCMSVVTYQ